MDGLANAGVKLDSFYTQPICAATRSSIMSGRYVIRTGFQHNNPPKGGGGVGALPLQEKLLPQDAKLRFLMLQTGVATGEQANAHLERLDLLRYEGVRLLANIRLFLRATPNELNLVIQLTQGNYLP